MRTPDKARDRALQRLGATLRKLREACGISLTDMARHLQVSEPYLHDVEFGNRTMTEERIRAIAARLDVAPETLLAIRGFCPCCDGTGFKKGDE